MVINTIIDNEEYKQLGVIFMWIFSFISGSNKGFEFRQQYEYIKLLEHHKCQKILQTDRSFVFCFMFTLDKYVLL